MLFRSSTFFKFSNKTLDLLLQCWHKCCDFVEFCYLLIQLLVVYFEITILRFQNTILHRQNAKLHLCRTEQKSELRKPHRIFGEFGDIAHSVAPNLLEFTGAPSDAAREVLHHRLFQVHLPVASSTTCA